MRQAQDPTFQELLRWARAAALTKDNLALLNSKVVTSLVTLELKGITTIVKLNTLWYYINYIQIEHFACSWSQWIFIFPAQHNRLPSMSSICIEDLLQQHDKGSKIPF